MSPSEIDLAVQAFLATQMSSIVQLEVLLLLRATEGRSWSAREIGHELRSDARWLQERLDDLVARGFLAVGEADGLATYTYAPRSEDDRILLDGVARAYEERRQSVISLVYARPPSDAPTRSGASTSPRKEQGE